MKEFTQQLEGVLDVFETTLSTRPYLAGKQLRSSLCTWGCTKGTDSVKAFGEHLRVPCPPNLLAGEPARRAVCVQQMYREGLCSTC